MGLTRRGFFGLLAAPVVAMTLDPEKALWVPGKKLISIPKPAIFRPMTATQIIQAAFRQIGALDVGETLSKATLDDAHFRLNAMLDSWKIPTGREAEYVDAAIYGMALRIAPMYGVGPFRLH